MPSVIIQKELPRLQRHQTSLAGHGFIWVQGGLYISQTEDLAQLFSALSALKDLPWLPRSGRDIRAFRLEQWSDVTALVKG